MKNEKDKKEEKEFNLKWPITVFFITFFLSIIFSFISTYSLNNIPLMPAIIILILIIIIGIFFDIVGVAVTIADEDEFHAKATKKLKGSKASLKLIKNSSKVANFCADVIGDICGVLSGAVSAIIAFKITEQFNLNFDIQFLLSALVASFTVSGKAVGKEFAKNNSTPIVHAVGKIVNKFTR